MELLILMIALLLLAAGFGVMWATKRHPTEINRGKDFSKTTSGWVSLSIGACFVGVLAFNSWTIVEPGYVKVGKIFGTLQEEVREEGFHPVNPLTEFEDYWVRRATVDFSGDTTLSALSADGVLMESVDVTFPYRLMPAAAPRVYQKVGSWGDLKKRLVIPAARSAVRDAIAEFDWRAATKDRPRLAARIGERFREILIADLGGIGFENPGEVVDLLPVQLRKIRPPNRIRAATAEKEAAKEDLQRQVTLTSIAEEVANRREQEGKGVRKLFEQLPEGFAAEDIARILTALANKTRADALMRGVKDENVKLIVLNGGSIAITP